jgi:hypothetical protein
MRRMNQAWKAVFLTGALILFAPSCSPILRLQATYQLPPSEGALAGKQAFVTVEDLRKDKGTFGERAAIRFEDSRGMISLSVAKGTAPGVIKGIYPPPALLKEAMESRMRHEGIHVVPEGTGSTGLSILLNSFFLDRPPRKWVVVISYEVRLLQEGQVLSRQIVSGEAERVDLLGTEQADVVLSDLLTDVVNRLDLSKLFRASEP